MSTTIPEHHREVLDAPYAVLSTLGADDYPQSTVVVFLHEDGLFKISLNTTRQKTKNLMRHPHGTLVVIDPETMRRYVEVRGDVEIVPDDDYTFAAHVGKKYGGTDFRYADKPGETRVGVILRPARVNVADLREP